MIFSGCFNQTNKFYNTDKDKKQRTKERKKEAKKMNQSLVMVLNSFIPTLHLRDAFVSDPKCVFFSLYLMFLMGFKNQIIV